MRGFNKNSAADRRPQVFDDPTRRRARIFGLISALILACLAAPFAGLALRIIDTPAVTPLTNPAAATEDLAPVARAAPPRDKVTPRRATPGPVSGIADPARPAAQTFRFPPPVLASMVGLGGQPGSLPEVDRNPMRTFAYLANDNDPGIETVLSNIDAIDVVFPEWYYIASSDGAIAEREAPGRNIGIDSIVGAHPSLRVIPVIDEQADEDASPVVIAKILKDRAKRRRLIDSLRHFALSNGFAGVNLAFGGLTDDLVLPYEKLVGELHREFAPMGLSVFVTVDPQDPAFRVDVLSRMADMVVVDMFHPAVDRASPAALAPHDEFARALSRLTASSDPSKLAIGIANYGYDWNLNERTVAAIGPQEALRIAQRRDAKVRFDPNALNPTFRYRDDKGDEHAVWYLDAASAFNQIGSVRDAGIVNVALGRLGGEETALWLLLDRSIVKDVHAALTEITFRHHIDYLGDGTVLEVRADSAPGRRSVDIDPGSGLVVDERIEAFPRVPTAFRQGKLGDRQIVLTFDDGPDPNFTNDILDILKENGIKATFFVIGRNVAKHPEILKRINEEGHDIGNHTFYHPNIALISDDRLRMELNATQRAIETSAGKRSFLFRPPYGEEMNPTAPNHMAPLVVATAAGYYTVGYTIDPKDWRTYQPGPILRRVVEGARSDNGGVVLLHDGGGDRSALVAALPSIIAELREENFTFATVSELMGQERDALMPPLSRRDAVLDYLQDIAFTMFRWSHDAFFMIFSAAIVLSVLRVGVIVVLALFNRSSRRPENDLTPSVAVIVPAFNEEAVIAKTVRSLLASNYPDLKIYVIDDGSTDRTAAVVRAQFAHEPRVQLFTKSNGGKSTALNYGFAVSESEIVVALDADTVFRSDTVYRLTRQFADPKVGAVAGNAKVGNRINLMTRWQALEYIVSQNLDRRALEMVNGITVVPGAVGAWRRSAVEAAGGFDSDTLAEDADLTIRINRAGYAIRNEPTAIAMTEAPDTVKGFLAQRSRWVLGTLQSIWKNKDAIFRPRSGSIGMVVLPYLLLFQFVLPLLAPIADFFVLVALGDAALQKFYHPTQELPHDFALMLWAYLLFVTVDFVVAIVAYVKEPDEDRSLIVWLPIQRFFYRQLLYYVTVKSVLRALAGVPRGWGQIARRSSVEGGLSMQRERLS